MPRMLCMFQMVHPSLLSQFESHKQGVAKKRAAPDADIGGPGAKIQRTSGKQMSLSVSAAGGHTPQTKVDQLIMAYIIEEMRPISTVRKPAFVNLVTGLAPGRTVPCPKTISLKIETKYAAMISDLVGQLATASFVCTTADIWSSCHRSYMGMTVHWITDDLGRRSAALACRRFSGAHTYDRIAEVINEVHSSFSLPLAKITSTVTDNASNFNKAFVTFTAPSKEEQHDSTDEEFEDENDVADSEGLSDDVEPIEITNILSNPDDDCDSDLYLPPHNKCVAHTLNLIASNDAEKALKNSAYSKIHHGSFGKCQGLWNAVHRSTKAADAVKTICGSKGLLFPCPTRWNSRYDAVSRLLQLVDKLPAMCDTLMLPKLKQNEIEFLKEYEAVLQPLARTLDFLQGEKGCFYGMLLPKIVQLRNKLSVVRDGNLVYTKPLATEIINGLSSRFDDLLNLREQANDAILAAVSTPQYKLRWVPPDRREAVSALFMANVVGLASCSMQTFEELGQLSEDDDDYGYGPDTNGTQEAVSVTASSHQESTVKIETMHYLDNPSKELSSLLAYPHVKAAFVKYNTTLPSSAPVERLFSVGGLIATPRRNRLSDTTFERLLMLKMNCLS